MPTALGIAHLAPLGAAGIRALTGPILQSSSFGPGLDLATDIGWKGEEEYGILDISKL